MSVRAETVSRPGGFPAGGPVAMLLAGAAVLAFALLVALRPQAEGAGEAAAMLDAILLWNSLLPRAAVALIAGAALGLSGALLQRVLRNPIADASTLGVASGAELAMTFALGFTPLIIGAPRELVAFGGGCAAVAIVLALAWRRGLDPVTVAIAGMIVSLIAASLSVALVLSRGEYALSIHIWGAGALNQQDWDSAISLGLRLALGMLAAAALLRPLTVLTLDDASARSLGVGLHAARLSILALAVWLSASVTATVGIIGFLGLAAPAMARLCGARSTGQVVMAAPLTGAAILLIADCLTQLLAPGFADLAPTGAATALLGGPLLLMLLPRARSAMAATATASARGLQRLRHPLRALWLLALALLLLTAVVLVAGCGPDGWNLAMGGLFIELLPFRLPRIVVAAGAGALLGAAGVVLQRLTANPLAGPEVMGVSTGAGAGLAATLFLVGFPSPVMTLAGLFLGALSALLAVIAFAARSGLAAERLLLAGIATGAFSMAVITLVLAQGDMRGYLLLTWMSGSTNQAGTFEAVTALSAVVTLSAPLFVLTRWLAILPLGMDVSRSIGLGAMQSRLALAVLAALMTAFASFLVGPLSLTGLIAPHLARLCGFHRPHQQLAAALMIGAGMLMLADWLARIAIYPYQLPVGLFAAIIGGPYLLWLLGKGGTEAE